MNITREFIEQLNMDEPYCFKNGREEQWFYIGLKHGLEVADNNPKLPWISVKNDLPCNHKELLMINNQQYSETFEVFATNKYGDIWTDCMINDNGEWQWHDFEPDYWMIPPKLPKERK